MPYFSGTNLGFLFILISFVKSLTIATAFGAKNKRQMMFIHPSIPIPMSAVFQINEESTIALITREAKNTSLVIKIAVLFVLPITKRRLFSII